MVVFHAPVIDDQTECSNCNFREKDSLPCSICVPFSFSDQYQMFKKQSSLIRAFPGGIPDIWFASSVLVKLGAATSMNIEDLRWLQKSELPTQDFARAADPLGRWLVDLLLFGFVSERLCVLAR